MADSSFQKVLDLIKEYRLRESSLGSRGILISSESDKGRVVNSAAFRRLQQKAQVFPLEPNAAVRTRLTHSVEVSQIGRHLVQKVIEKHQATDSESYAKLAAFVNTIETACLLHDIGNPPFGHLGEAAIRDWFKKRQSEGKTAPADLLNFDGNPQGFRLASFLSGADEYGFNLTCTLLLSMVKYPVTSVDKAADPSHSKIGLFATEYKSYADACDKLDWEARKKFPFVRLMDAADDIAYSMSDLEDGLEKDIISIGDLSEAFGADKFAKGAVDPFVSFKTGVINRAVEEVAQSFVKNIDAILHGDDIKLLSASSEIGALVKEVNAFARSRIYTDKSAEQVELAGRSVIWGLLNHFGALLDLDEADFLSLMKEDQDAIKKKQLDFPIRLLRRIPKNYRSKYQVISKGDEETRRAHLIVDFISGMTDDFALETYQILEGIRIR